MGLYGRAGGRMEFDFGSQRGDSGVFVPDTSKSHIITNNFFSTRTFFQPALVPDAGGANGPDWFLRPLIGRHAGGGLRTPPPFPSPILCHPGKAVEA